MKLIQVPFCISIGVALGRSGDHRTITITGKVDIETYDLPLEKFLIDAANEAITYLAATNDDLADDQVPGTANQ